MAVRSLAFFSNFSRKATYPKIINYQTIQDNFIYERKEKIKCEKKNIKDDTKNVSKQSSTEKEQIYVNGIYCAFPKIVKTSIYFGNKLRWVDVCNVYIKSMNACEKRQTTQRDWLMVHFDARTLTDPWSYVRTSGKEQPRRTHQYVPEVRKIYKSTGATAAPVAALSIQR